jgi:hypothetical protein
VGSDGKTYSRPAPKPPRVSGFTHDLTPVRRALRQLPEQVARFNQLADDDRFRVWFAETDSLVADIRRNIANAIEQLQRLDERVQQVVSESPKNHEHNASQVG